MGNNILFVLACRLIMFLEHFFRSSNSGVIEITSGFQSDLQNSSTSIKALFFGILLMKRITRDMEIVTRTIHTFHIGKRTTGMAI